MKNKKIIYIVLILFLFLFSNPLNAFATTHITVKNHNNENIFFTLPNEFDQFQYILIIEGFRDDSSSYKVYWSNEPFSISSIEGTSYFFSSNNGAYWTYYSAIDNDNFDISTVTPVTQHYSNYQAGYAFKVIFSTFNLADSNGNIIFAEGEYGVDYTNTNNSEDFYEGNSGAIVQGPSTSIDTSATSDNVNNAANEIFNKFSFTDTIKNNVNGLIDFITSIEPCPTLTLDVSSKWYTGTLKIIDLSFYEPYKEAGDLIIVAFAYLLFLWQIFLKLPDIVNGVGSAAYSVSSYSESRVNSQLKGGKK